MAEATKLAKLKAEKNAKYAKAAAEAKKLAEEQEAKAKAITEAVAKAAAEKKAKELELKAKAAVNLLKRKQEIAHKKASTKYSKLMRQELLQTLFSEGSTKKFHQRELFRSIYFQKG